MGGNPLLIIGVLAIAFGGIAIAVRDDYARRVAAWAKDSPAAQRRLRTELLWVGIICMVIGAAIAIASLVVATSPSL